MIHHLEKNKSLLPNGLFIFIPISITSVGWFCLSLRFHGYLLTRLSFMFIIACAGSQRKAWERPFWSPRRKIRKRRWRFDTLVSEGQKVFSWWCRLQINKSHCIQPNAFISSIYIEQFAIILESPEVSKIGRKCISQNNQRLLIVRIWRYFIFLSGHFCLFLFLSRGNPTFSPSL